jgi:hypothetical protein
LRIRCIPCSIADIFARFLDITNGFLEAATILLRAALDRQLFAADAMVERFLA